MAKRKPKNPADYIEPLHMNGMRGRMLRMPPTGRKNREILMVYGHHASLERIFGLAEDLNKYGGVTAPDLPGFGGMQSFYRIGEKPSLDNLADYLAAFIKLRYKRRRITIMGMSLGFVIVTQMLQKYPELAAKVDLLVSTVGFVHHDDFKFKRRTFLLYRYGSVVFSSRLPAWIARTFILRGPFIRAAYMSVADNHSKLRDADVAERRKRVDFEITLWKSNDIRTYMETTTIMMTLDLCHKRVELPVYHIEVADDRYFDNRLVEQHMRVIYRDFFPIASNMPGHAPTVVATAREAAPFIPAKIRRLLAQA